MNASWFNLKCRASIDIWWGGSVVFHHVWEINKFGPEENLSNFHFLVIYLDYQTNVGLKYQVCGVGLEGGGAYCNPLCGLETSSNLEPMDEWHIFT